MNDFVVPGATQCHRGDGIGQRTGESGFSTRSVAVINQLKNLI
jgi:hypothetical protein